MICRRDTLRRRSTLANFLMYMLSSPSYLLNIFAAFHDFERARCRRHASSTRHLIIHLFEIIMLMTSPILRLLIKSLSIIDDASGASLMYLVYRMSSDSRVV